MKGDFSRITFDQMKHFSRVLMQQGRVQLDADWNEQTAILLHYLQTLAADLIGPHGGPGEGFSIWACKDEQDELIECNDAGLEPLENDFFIHPGHYYVDGILCENEAWDNPPTYTSQPDLPAAPPLEDDGTYLVYLDVWERHITYIEDEDQYGEEPGIREVALGGADTAGRAKVIWQVKVTASDAEDCPTNDAWDDYVAGWQPENRGRMIARARAPQTAEDKDPCITPPEARYRGVENQLYRVEIHNGGQPRNGDSTVDEDTATFKWSRENGSVVFPIHTFEPSSGAVTLEHMGQDDKRSLQVGDWVEIVDDTAALHAEVRRLFKVIEPIDRMAGTITLDLPENVALTAYDEESTLHPLLRRWDQRETNDVTLYRGAVPLEEGVWLDLEDGVQISFATGGASGNGGAYRTGDYWLVPARTATGDVEWPGTVEAPEALAPHGVEHHYAPLAMIVLAPGGEVTVSTQCHKVFQPLTDLSAGE